MIQLFWNLTERKIKGRGHGWGQRSKSQFTQYSTDTPPFCFISIGPTIPEICTSVWPWKNISEISKKVWQKYSFKILSGNKHDQKYIATKFCSDWLSGSHFILQARKILFVNATAVTLGQGHTKVIHYIFPDLYFLCPKYLRYSSKGFDVRSKSHCSARGSHTRSSGNKRKT